MDQFGLDFKSCHRLTNRLDQEVALWAHHGLFYWRIVTKPLPSVIGRNDGGNGISSLSLGNLRTMELRKAMSQILLSSSGIINQITMWPGNIQLLIIPMPEWMAEKAVVEYWRSHQSQSSCYSIRQRVWSIGRALAHMDYQVTGTGKAMMFQDGNKSLLAPGAKLSPTVRTKFMAEGRRLFWTKVGSGWKKCRWGINRDYK